MIIYNQFFFFIFGTHWNSYIYHASFINIIATLSFFIFLKEFKVKRKLIAIYLVSFATLCYPVSGTPFAYLHSYVFSLISIFFLMIAINRKDSRIWFFIPILFFISFFSMQTPSAYIIILSLVFIFYFFIKNKNTNAIKQLILGTTACLIFSIFYLIISKTSLSSFLYQYFLFPLTIGEGRFISNELAYVKLQDQINFKRIFGDFKFIHLFLFSLVFITILKIKSKNNKYILLNLFFILSCLLFLINQILQANQIYIFSLIPILLSVCNINYLENDKFSKISSLLLVLLIFITLKYHERYNIDRKFLDIEKKNKNFAISANILDKKFGNLKWITPNYEDPMKEIEIIKTAFNIIKKDMRNKSLLTHYQFFSTFTNQDLNIWNRWYVWDNNSHPTPNHKYHDIYKQMINENLKKNKIQVIYLLSSDNEINFQNIKEYFDNICFKHNTIIEKKFSSHEIINCKEK